MAIVILSVIWFLCGLIGVFIGGIADKKTGLGQCCPIPLVFFTGPIGFLVTLIALMNTIDFKFNLSPLNYIYNKGYNKGFNK